MFCTQKYIHYLQRLADYSIGFVRYELDTRTGPPYSRVQFEHELKNAKVTLIENHPGLEGKYWTMGTWRHYQGFYMAAPEQLRGWRDRPPACRFAEFPQQDHQGMHREYVGGGISLHDPHICNVTQLIPLDRSEDFFVWHMSQKYFQHPHFSSLVVPIMDLHHDIRWKLQDARRWNTSSSFGHDQVDPYAGINMYDDEHNDSMKPAVPLNLSEYEAYVARGGLLYPTQMSNGTS